MSKFVATETMAAFMRDLSFVRLLAGPIGAGKSVCCVHELVRLSLLQKPNQDGVRKTRTAIIRNTADQLRTTVFRTWCDWFPPGVWGHYKVQEKTFYMAMNLPDGTSVDAQIMFLPLDGPEDVRKVLSLELTYAFINEAREVRAEIIDGILMRLRRYPGMKDGGPTHSCAIMDTNMPDIDTYLFNQMESPPENWGVHIQPPAILSFEEYTTKFDTEPDPEDAITDARHNKWWVNPESDNVANLDPQYYPGIVPGKTEDFIDVYLRCKYGRSLAGLPVYDKTFNREFHVNDGALTAIRSEDYPLIIGLDLGRTPSCVIGQRNTFGQLVVLAEIVSENMGIETFLSRKLIPRLAEDDLIGCHVVVAPDPAGWAKQQIGEVSPVDIIRTAGFEVVRPITNDPARRVEAVERLLLDHIAGRPALVIDPRCKQLIKGFSWGYKYKLHRNGVQDDKPLKDEHSHLADAMQYFCLVADSPMQAGREAVSQTARDVQIVSASGWT